MVIVTHRQSLAQFHFVLLGWHAHNSRSFPWREAENAWAVLVAEILLQRTQAIQAEPVFKKLINLYPTPISVQQTDSEVIKEIIGSLGLIKRAEVLKTVADQIISQHRGIVPNNYDALIRLPGVGPYIANAVLCFGFDQQVPIVDANVIRIFERYFALRTTRSRARDDPNIWRFAASILPAGHAKEFNLALLDFEALVCTPREPKCPECPLTESCVYRGSAPMN